MKFYSQRAILLKTSLNHVQSIFQKKVTHSGASNV